jgi:L-aminopeptidase/D-esterase-like protein
MKRNTAITDVPGIEVGHAQDDEALTGVTVVLCRRGAVGGVDVRGSAPGTRETDLLDPVNLVEKVHAVTLAGGSAFGLEAASGVARWLEEQGIGFDTGVARVPIVPAAILYDLDMGRADVRPNAVMGYAAAASAVRGPVPEGNVGAGTGASVGKIFGAAGARDGSRLLGKRAITASSGSSIRPSSSHTRVESASSSATPAAGTSLAQREAVLGERASALTSSGSPWGGPV